MELYSAIDLHSNNSHIAIIDNQHNREFYRKLVNDAKLIEGAFAPYRDRLKGIVIEPTLNWYWLADLLIEKAVRCKAVLKEPFPKLLTLPGVGDILAMTILLETGPIERFEAVGHYVSYCRKVSSRFTSNEKTKGKGNTHNGRKRGNGDDGDPGGLSRQHVFFLDSR